jgi:N-methylhydantoinase B
MHHGEASCRFPPVEIWESRNPWLLERVELAADSGGAGAWRGGLGVDMFFHVLEDCWVTSALERTKLAPWGIRGGHDGRPNSVRVRHPDGSHTPSFGKATGLALRRGTTVELQTGGGGGFGPPETRDPAAVHADVQLGYISEAQARKDYPHAYQQGESA